MKYKAIILSLTLISASLITSKVYGQNDRQDNLETASRNEAKIQETKDENRMADAKADRKTTKAKAKEAKRMDRDAKTAAKESKYALKSEKKAQKSRRQADDQTKKASKARDKSNNN
jgi:hypothetical protein